MSAVIEYVRFDVTDVEELTKTRDALVAHLRNVYGNGLISTYLGVFDDGSVVDVMIWASREVADQAAAEILTDPAAAPFLSKISGVQEMRHAKVLHAS